MKPTKSSASGPRTEHVHGPRIEAASKVQASNADSTSSTDLLTNTDDGRTGAAPTAGERLEVIKRTHIWSKGHLNVRGLHLYSEASEAIVQPENVPLHCFIAKCLRTGQIHFEFWRIDQPPELLEFAHRAKECIDLIQLQLQFELRASGLQSDNGGRAE